MINQDDILIKKLSPKAFALGLVLIVSLYAISILRKRIIS